MKLLLSLLILLSLHTHAAEYLIYSSQSQIIKERLNGKNVFTMQEREFLKEQKLDIQVIKVEAEDEKTLRDFLQTQFPDAEIEKNNKVEIFSTTEQFEHLQWGLKNNGEILEDWISDIDVLQTIGTAGEDISLLDNEKAEKILVAIIDSGLDIQHPDLIDQVYHHAGECQALKEYNECLNSNSDQNSCHEKWATFDANGNGYPLDCHGWNITGKSNPKTDIEGNGNISDNNGHGTHVAGIIGAKKNGIGIRGVIQNVRLLPVQVSVASQNANQGQAATDKFAKALLYAIKSKAQVINMSLGWRFEQDSLLMREMIKLAHKNNILVVAAAGNDHHAAPTYPCSYEEVICVGAHTVDGQLSSFSNYGAHVDITAPGTRILSTWPTTKRSRSFTIDDNYEYLSGTSQATPFVTGVLARLLNQGFTPEMARIALLSGARKRVRHQENYIRHGNVDYKNAISKSVQSFLYPSLKSPALIKWTEENTKVIKIKIKNYLKETKNIKASFKLIQKSTQPETFLIHKEMESGQMQAGEEKEFTLGLSSPYDVDGNFVLEMNLSSEHENKTYYLQAKAINLIAPETKLKNQESFQILASSDYAKDALIRPFKNYTQDTGTDFLITKVIDGKTHISLLKELQNHYELSDHFPIPIKDPIFINLSKVDLDFDGKSDYVLTALNIIDQDNRETRFFVLDDLFRPKRYNIAPKNTFKNDITVLPGSFHWLRFQKRMVPAWITMGLRPENERPCATPWAAASIESRMNYLYLQLEDGVKTIPFASADERPLHFLYQSPTHRVRGETILISSVGLGYFKQYKLYRFNDGLEYIQDIELQRYFDLASARPLPLTQPEDNDHAFFNTPSILGEQNVIAFEWNNQKSHLNVVTKKALTINAQNPIKFVLSFSQDAILSQTDAYIIAQGEKVSSGPAQTDAKRIKHHILTGKQGIFLSSSLTPGIGAELIRPYPSNQELYRPANWQKLGVKGCQEVGFILENKVDKLVYICSESQLLFKFSL